ncbi:MAG: hypothetical protein WCB53_16240 [Terriglobales bacterium]
MIFSKNPRTDGIGWRRALIFVAICSLALCVATRFSVSVSAQGHGVKSMDLRSGGNKQQHLDQDHVVFAAPVVTSSAAIRIVLYSSSIPPEPPCSQEASSPVLLNRPPPVSAIVFI